MPGPWDVVGPVKIILLSSLIAMQILVVVYDTEWAYVGGLKNWRRLGPSPLDGGG